MTATEAEQDLRDRASRFLKGEMKKSGVTYDELIRRLATMGLHETKASIANMLNRGSFPATFLLATMKAIGRQSIDLKDLWTI